MRQVGTNIMPHLQVRKLKLRKIKLFSGLHRAWEQSLTTISVKSEVVSSSGFVGHMVSVGTIQLCLYSVRAATNNVWMNVRGSALSESFIYTIKW